MAIQRDTTQRQAIRKAFRQAGRPLNPQEVLRAARPAARGLGIATVYRALKDLLRRGDITAVQIPGEPPRYEICGKSHHHYFRCRSCQQVFDINGCPGNFRGLTPRGFRLEDHELVLYGLCGACNRPPRS